MRAPTHRSAPGILGEVPRRRESRATLAAGAGACDSTVTGQGSGGPPVRIEVRPAYALVKADSTYKFSAWGIDSGGDAEPVGASWHAENGSIDTTGLYSPSAVGTWGVEARFGGLRAEALADVVPGRIAHLIVSPTGLDIIQGQNRTIAANGSDSVGNEPRTMSVAWSEVSGLLVTELPAPGGGKELRVTGLKPGRWELHLVAGDGEATARATVLVTVKSNDYAGL